MTTRLEAFRDHCARMSEADHKPECPSLTPEPYFNAWGFIYDAGGEVQALRWRGPKPRWEPPKCDGCVSDADRALFARLAAEADRHIQGELWESA